MNMMTQEQFAEKYEVSRPYVSKVFKDAGILPEGLQISGNRKVNLYPEKGGAIAIMNALMAQAEKARKVYDEANRVYKRVETLVRENGLIDNQRWRL